MLSDGKGISDQLQPGRIEPLREQRFLANEHQVAGGCVHGTCVGIDQTSSFQLLLEVADVNTTVFGTSSHVVEKVATVRQELRREITAPLGQPRQRDRLPARGGNFGYRSPQRRKQN